MKTLITVISFAVAIVIISSSAYTVDQTEQVFITEFGKPVGTPINADPAN